jgi:hypothetical protein
MSLLNDALKRADEANRTQPGSGPPLPPLRPADYVTPYPGGLRLLLGVLVVLALGASGFFLSRWLVPGGDPPPARSTGAAAAAHPGDAPGPIPARPLPAADTASTALPQTSAPSTPALRGAGARGNTPPAATAASPPVRAASAPAPAAEPEPAPRVAEAGALATSATRTNLPPALKLQSIIFRLRNPAAVINGQMLGVGDVVDGARLLRIERHAVTLEREGKTNVLELPRF